MAYELMVRDHFAAAHALRGYQGDCARLHGHNWIVEVYVVCEGLNDIGIGIDYKVLKGHMKDVISHWDHYNLNDIPPFTEINATSENVARILYETMADKLKDEAVRMSRVRIWETPNACVTYSE